MTEYAAVYTTSGRLFKQNTNEALQELTLNATILRAYLSGLRTYWISNNSINVASGICADTNNSQMLVNSSNLTINISTTGINALDTGNVANSTTYHIYVIGKADGNVATIASSSNVAPTMPSDYIVSRRIGSILTSNIGNIIQYRQIGDYFQWKTPIEALNAQSFGHNTTGTLSLANTVPMGIYVESHSTVQVTGQLEGFYGFSLHDDYVNTPSSNLVYIAGYRGGADAGGAIASGRYRVLTTTNARISYFAHALGNQGIGSVSVTLNILGWYDRRGQDD